ncbi:MAG: SRPBCC domain-containing protein [Chitinophagales bacterium]
MERKTQVHAEAGRQDLLITRVFELPVDLLYRAFTEADIVQQWMNTHVIKLESKTHGSWQFETLDPSGNVAFKANGTIHILIPEEKLVRTFEMENAAFGVQLEILEFKSIDENTSSLQMHSIYESVELRDAMLKLPFAYGINMAHDRLQEILQSLK